MTAIAVTVVAVLVMFAGMAVPAQAQTPTLLYTFMQTTDACAPRGNVVQGRDGNMYGGGASCGANGSGAIYKISPAGVESVFYSFSGQWLNCGGAGLTLGNDGNFYGACESGNPATGMGSIFRLTPAGVFTDLYDFTGANGDSLPIYPPIQASDGNFYGVTGNEVQVCGNIYKLTPAGVYKNLHAFSGSDCHSSNLFQAGDGNLYGTLANCNVVQGAGCVYKISTAGVFKEIHDFAYSSGQEPCTGLIQGKDGKLYGATNQGAANGSGDIYKMTTAGAATDLHDFNNATDASCVNNVGPPVSLLQVADGSFYGVNPAYGPNGTGSIYKLTSANVFSAYLFPNPPVDGDLPSSTLIQNTNGLVYGTTPSGGGGGGGCPQVCQGTFFSVATGDKPFVRLEPTEKSGNVGAKVGMFGQGFGSASVVKFGGVAATSVTLSGTTYLTAVVPVGAHTGAVT
ncbi:MAG: choice-of-anchor tandem repeat GloVer-containing protein, partial [Terriglobales bacterium]